MKRIFLSAIVVAVLASPAYGQTEDIVVIAKRIGGANVDTLTSPTTILTEQEIKARGNDYISDLLRTIPGASINRSGPAGGLTQLRLRGTEGNHVLVLVDGVEVDRKSVV